MEWWPAGFTLLAASLLPVQAALNGALNRALGNATLVVLISLSGSAIFMGAVGIATGTLAAPSFGRISAVPWWAWPAGVCGAIYLSSQPIVAPRLGAGTFISLSVTAQVGAALLIDHFGALGLIPHPASPLRVLGAVLMACGVVLIARF